jgi:tocopherol O-methyltransferase
VRKRASIRHRPRRTSRSPRARRTTRPELTIAPVSGLHEAIRRYYEHTRLDYRIVWFDRRNLALHFGYRDEHARTHARSLLRLNEVLAERAEIRAGERVLDAGCGIGGSSLWLAAERGAEVVGVNVVPAQVREAERYARARGLDGRARFLVRDYADTGLPDASLDVVWMLESLCHAPDKPAALREARRLLAPGGRLAVVEYVLEPGTPEARDAELLLRWLEAWSMPSLATRAELTAWLEAAGFADVRFEDMSRNVAPSLRRLDRLCALFRPGAWALCRLGLASPTRYANLLASRRLFELFRRGVGKETIVTARVPGSP